MPGLKSIDENLPRIVDHSILSWLRRFDKLREDRTEAGERLACTFALTGHYRDEDTDSDARARLIFSDRAIRPNLVIHQVCDIDSVIGVVTDEFPIQNEAVFEYHLINDISYCLTSDLHIPGWLDVNTQGASNDLLPYHKIPHAVFGTMDNGRTIVRMFLPEAVGEEEGSYFLTKRLLEPFYDLAVKPAAQRFLLDHYMRTWPPSYAAEEARAARRVGKPQFSGKALRGAHLKQLVRNILEIVGQNHDLVFARRCFWMVEMKGVKAGTTHPPLREPPLGPALGLRRLADGATDGNLRDALNDPRTLAISRLFANWEFANFEEGQWYLDIATTVSVRREDGTPVSVLIRKDAHPEILRRFTGEPIHRCTAWASRDNGRDYQFDATAQLEGIGGCRLTIRDKQDKDVRYFQAYTTEKCLTYHRDGASVALNSSAWRTMENWEKEDARFFQPAIQMFKQAGDEGTTSHIAARFESRVPFDKYPLVHTSIDDLDLRNWLYFFDTTHIWGIKARRMYAARETINRVLINRPLITWKFLPEVSSLIIILVWAANALANRPAEGGTWNEVRDSGSVHKLDRAGQPVPHQPLGCYMLHSLVTHPTYRLSGDRTISTRTIMSLVFTKDKNATIADLYLMLNPTFGSEKKRPASVRWGDEPDPVPSRRQPAGNNKRRNINISLDTPAPAVFGAEPGLIAIPGLDEQVEEICSSEDEDEEERHRASVTYEELNELLRDVAVQVLAKAPSQGDERVSYCRLNEQEKMEATNGIFKTANTLSSTWVSYTLFTDAPKWQNTVQRLFPTRLEYCEMTVDRQGKKVQVQGLSSMAFWKAWQIILRRVSPDLEKAIVRAMRQHINTTWHWFPVIEGRKLWNTARKPTKKHVGKPDTGPWIACNPRFIS
ncbi:hypothetical protein FRC10_009305 [Ceratobasidium sp. 414]|nr:hypothetical protein FRC10_009305 [Ceratobasidium sp. 414]